MQEREAYALLVLAAARDNRQVSAEVARVWASDLAGVDPRDAADAMQAHYREKSGVWLMPGHILDQVKRLRSEREREARVQRALAGAPPDSPDRAEFFAMLDREGLTPMQWAMREVELENPRG